METSHLLSKTDTASAVDASIHVSYHKRPNVLVLDCTLILVVATGCIAVEVRVVLEVALTALIANGTVERMVGQQELHDSSAGVAGGFGVGVNFHGRGDLGAAGSDWFGTLFDFDKTHPAVACDFEAFVVAEAGDFYVVFLGGLEDGEVVIHLIGLVVDEDLNLLGREGGVGTEDPPQHWRTQHHQYILYSIITNPPSILGPFKLPSILLSSSVKITRKKRFSLR